MKATLVLFLCTAALAPAETRETFDAAAALPKGWETGITGKGSAQWDVVADPAAPSAPNVLKQSGRATYCWAAKTDVKIKDGFVEVKSKPVSGKTDQAAGLVWRFKDARNYYVVRSNAIEGNVVLYKTVDGKRSSLLLKGETSGYGVDASVPNDRWSTLRVEFKGNLFTVIFDGKKLFQVEDDSIADAGAVGVWTKADSVTLFDNFTYGGK